MNIFILFLLFVYLYIYYFVSLFQFLPVLLFSYWKIPHIGNILSHLPRPTYLTCVQTTLYTLFIVWATFCSTGMYMYLYTYMSLDLFSFCSETDTDKFIFYSVNFDLLWDSDPNANSCVHVFTCTQNMMQWTDNEY